MSATKLSGIERAFEAFCDRVEGAIRRVPASEVAAERERLRAEAIEAVARHVRMTAKAPNVARRRSDWSGLGFNIGALIAVLVFIVAWALTALMGGLWGFLLGWLPASIIARFCFYAWPLVLAVVVIAGFGIAAAVNQNSAPQPAADPYAGIGVPAPAAQASNQGASSAQVAQAATNAPPMVQPVAAVQDAQATAPVAPGPVAAPPVAAPELHSYTNTFEDGERIVVEAENPYDAMVIAGQRYAAEHGTALPKNTPVPGAAHKPITQAEFDAVVAACPTHTTVYDPATAGLVCAPYAYPKAAPNAPAPLAAPAAGPSAVAPSASAPVPVASQPQQVAQR